MCRFIRCLRLQFHFIKWVFENSGSAAVKKAAKSFLLTADAEELLDIALMATIAVEDLIITRLGDAGVRFDVSMLDQTLTDFILRCKYLIVDRGALTSKTSYANILMRILGNEPLVYQVGNVDRVIGPPDAATIDRCFDRMNGWLTLAVQ